ncbi:FadR/GntR family transcriptional regulator [Streptomyces sp. TS71-3]|uniref:FadR/GntR family transcriptional regulator n=1 Tax=Streptomyces sp. TS71-3 TaxID=2733862 RepID=UPI001B0A3896|nr:FCD domain-containing protein [Streptomyces sp. TS71-3]GHJ37055.1 GntR family transcriptional regulator [Streptomyces sp. TS71-3]
MPLRSPARSNLVDSVIEQVEDLIRRGEWPVGSKVPAEPVLVEELGVGRNTVREALRALAHTGLLAPRPGDGTYVLADSGLGAAVRRRLRHSDTIEAYEVRASLERDAARYAALRRTEADVTRLWDALAVREDAWGEDGADTSAFVEADLQFHRAVAAAAGNAVLAELYDQFSDSLRRALRSVVGAPLPEAARRQVAEHTAIVVAIESGDAEAAERAALHHLSAAMDALRDLSG